MSWINKIPSWITIDLSVIFDTPNHPERPAKLSRCSVTSVIQAICNRCDAPRPGAISRALFPCFASEAKLERDSGVCQRHVKRVKKFAMQRGYIVPLRIARVTGSHRGKGRAANVYGVPGVRGELDFAWADEPSANPRWHPEDTADLRRRVEGRAEQKWVADQLESNPPSSKPQGTQDHFDRGHQVPCRAPQGTPGPLARGQGVPLPSDRPTSPNHKTPSALSPNGKGNKRRRKYDDPNQLPLMFGSPAVPPPAKEPAPTAKQPTVSKPASRPIRERELPELVRVAVELCERTGGDPFTFVKLQRPKLTREQFDAALREVAHA